jgi:uncharacterized lipoprotein YddW (UPF0748 family)
VPSHPARLLGTLLAAVLVLTAAAPVAAAAPTGQCARDSAAPKQQLRAEWIASVTNIDWPSRPGLPADQQKAELVRWYDEAVALGLNAVVVQIRPTADAFWPSKYEPWSQWLTGAQGQDPGYDPLKFAVDEAHKRNLEFHGWFNPFRVSMNTDVNALLPTHPARVHPDWVVAYGGKLYYNPGVPEVRKFTIDAIMDAVKRYDIDAVHFDDYFYPYPVAGQTFDDTAAYAQYGGGLPLADWRRKNIDSLISGLSSAIRSAKPWVQFGVSPFAVWRNAATDPAGSPTQAGVQTYDDLYADTVKWVKEEWLDYITPQVYWNIGFEVADYAKLVPWWSSVVSGTRVNLYIGHANHKVANPAQPAAWQDPAEMSRQLTFNQDYPQVKGDIYFSAAQVRANRLNHMSIVKADHYQHPALPPTAGRLTGRGPSAPLVADAARTSTGLRLRWLSNAATSFAVYRLDGHKFVERCDLADASHLVGTVRAVRGPLQSFTDPTAVPGQRYTYLVTALDRSHNESGASMPRFTIA